MSSLMLACTKHKKKFKDRHCLTPHHGKLTTCRTQSALNINVNLVHDDALLPPDLLAFLCVNLTKHRQTSAKNPLAKTNLPSRQPQINKTNAAKTTGQKSSLETMSKDDDNSDVDFAPLVFTTRMLEPLKNRLLRPNRAVCRIYLTLIGSTMIELNTRNGH